jgi:hypothetical protein
MPVKAGAGWPITGARYTLETANVVAAAIVRALTSMVQFLD